MKLDSPQRKSSILAAKVKISMLQGEVLNLNYNQFERLYSNANVYDKIYEYYLTFLFGIGNTKYTKRILEVVFKINDNMTNNKVPHTSYKTS